MAEIKSRTSRAGKKIKTPQFDQKKLLKERKKIMERIVFWSELPTHKDYPKVIEELYARKREIDALLKAPN